MYRTPVGPTSCLLLNAVVEIGGTSGLRHRGEPRRYTLKAGCSLGLGRGAQPRRSLRICSGCAQGWPVVRKMHSWPSQAIHVLLWCLLNYPKISFLSPKIAISSMKGTRPTKAFFHGLLRFGHFSVERGKDPDFCLSPTQRPHHHSTISFHCTSFNAMFLIFQQYTSHSFIQGKDSAFWLTPLEMQRFN